jgi:hypothetical protein
VFHSTIRTQFARRGTANNRNASGAKSLFYWVQLDARPFLYELGFTEPTGNVPNATLSAVGGVGNDAGCQADGTGRL